MKYLSNKNGFLGIDNKFNFKEKVVVVPFGLEKTVSYGGGTKNGPKEIIKASHQVELFDEELNKEPYKEIGIKTLKPFPIKNKIELNYLFPFNWVFIGVLGIVLDLVKAPGYVLGAILATFFRSRTYNRSI